MSQPVSFASGTPRFRLPFLYPAQAQKEFTVNEALARIDAVSHPAIEGVASRVPDDPAAGDCWLVAPDATDFFAGHDEELAFFDGSQWSFIAPLPGMAVFDKARAVIRRYSVGWSEPASVAAPVGGGTIDAEARQAIVALLQALEGLSLLRHG